MGILTQKQKKMKFFVAALALVKANDLDNRLAIIMDHADRLAEAVLDMDDAKDARYMDKLNHWANAISAANGDRDGAECDAEVEEAGDVQVFSEGDWCKLNSQINSALSSAARRWGCDGRVRFARQAVRRLKKVKNQYNRLHC